MTGTETQNQDDARKPWPFAEEMAERQREVARGAEPWNLPVEERRAVRRRDMELLRLASMEAAFHITEYIAGRLPNWKKEALEKLRNPVADLANLNRAIIQITLAEDRFDETAEERTARIQAEAEAEVRAKREAEAARAQAEATLRRAENKRQVKGLVRAVSLSSIRIPFTEREKLLDDLFRELETEDDTVSVYNGDPAETAADLCLRLGFGPKAIDSKSILERRAALVAAARAHLEGLRGAPQTEDDSPPDATVLPFAQAKAQGPPN
jgi:hypothetical protein